MAIHSATTYVLRRMSANRLRADSICSGVAVEYDARTQLDGPPFGVNEVPGTKSTFAWKLPVARSVRAIGIEDKDAKKRKQQQQQTRQQNVKTHIRGIFQNQTSRVGDAKSCHVDGKNGGMRMPQECMSCEHSSRCVRYGRTCTTTEMENTKALTNPRGQAKQTSPPRTPSMTPCLVQDLRPTGTIQPTAPVIVSITPVCN